MHEDVLSEYALTPHKVEPLEGGLINKSFLVHAQEGTFVLQALHPIFAADVHYDIDAVTQHLKAKGMATPELVRTKRGELYVQAGEIWRVMTYLPSRTFERVTTPGLASAAGELVGRFHSALSDLRHEFRFKRRGVHDTAGHLAALQSALVEHRTHRHFDRIAPIGEAILAAERLPLDLSKTRVAHGDLKITNLLFDGAGRGVALIDLDTLGMMPLAHEMGDAWRSWCNPGGEDDPDARFDLELFEAAATAYVRAMGSGISADERSSLVTGIATIALELAARFCADALRESYFGWNANKFPDRSTHNLIRAKSQLHLHQSVMQQAHTAERILENA